MTKSEIIVKQDRGVCIIRFNRYERARNAIGLAMSEEIKNVLDKIQYSKDIKVVVFFGHEKCFAAGMDIKDSSAKDIKKRWEFTKVVDELFYQILTYPKATIAGVSGIVMGAGLELASSCDLRLASDSSTFQFPAVKYGMSTGSSVLPLIIGIANAKEMVFTAAAFDAIRAKEMGLVNRVVIASKLEEETLKLARQIANNSVNAIKKTKEMLLDGIYPNPKVRVLQEVASHHDWLFSNEYVDIAGVRKREERKPRQSKN